MPLAECLRIPCSNDNPRPTPHAATFVARTCLTFSGQDVIKVAYGRSVVCYRIVGRPARAGKHKRTFPKRGEANMTKQDRPTEEFRQEHEHLMTHVTDLRRTMDGLRTGLAEETMAGLKEADGFFQAALKPHAQWEEENLYPVATDIIREHGKPSATMEVDHVDLVSRMDSFRSQLESVQDGKATPEDVDRLR